MDQQLNPTQNSGMQEQITDQADAAMKSVRASLDQAMASASERAREYARYADRQVQSNPWMAVGISFAAGAALGALIALAAGAGRGSRFGR